MKGGPSRADGIEVAKVEDSEIFTGKPEGPKCKIAKTNVVGIDIAKRVHAITHNSEPLICP